MTASAIRRPDVRSKDCPEYVAHGEYAPNPAFFRYTPDSLRRRRALA